MHFVQWNLVDVFLLDFPSSEVLVPFSFHRVMCILYPFASASVLQMAYIPSVLWSAGDEGAPYVQPSHFFFPSDFTFELPVLA